MGANVKGKQVNGNRYHPYYLFENEKDGKTRLYKLLENGDYHDEHFSSHSGDKVVQEAVRLRDNYVANQARKEKQAKNTSVEPEPQEVLKGANDNQIDLTAGMATTEDEFRDISNYILAEARDTGISPDQLLKMIRQNPDILPESIREKFAKEGGYFLGDILYNRLYNFLAKDQDLENLEERLRDKQEERKNIYDDLATLPAQREKADQSTLARMVSPEAGIEGYQDIWGRLSDENKEDLTPQGLHSLDTMQGLDALKTQGQDQSKLYSRLMPGEDFSIDWGQNPTYERARDTYNTDFKPNYAYSSTAPFDQKEHALGASGHALGSTSLENNDSARQRAMHKEDLENIFNIQNMLEKEHRARGDTLKQIEGLGESGRTALGEPIKTSEDVLGKQFDRAFDQNYKQNEFKTNIAEGGMNLATTEMGEESSLYNLLKAQNQESQAEQKQLNNEIYSYLMNVEQLRKGGVKEQMELKEMEQNLWVNKMNVINAVKALSLQERSLDMQEKAQELERSANNKAQFLKVLGTIGLGALAMAVPGGSALAGVATMAPGIAKMANFGAQGIPNQGWFNNKATG